MGKTDRRTQIAQRMNLLKLISHTDNKLYEDDILGALIGRRSQPREREDYKQCEDTSYEGGGPECYGRGKDASKQTFPGGVQGKPREKTSQRLRIGGLILFTIRI